MAFRLNKKSIVATILAATLVLNLSSINVIAVELKRLQTKAIKMQGINSFNFSNKLLIR